MSIRLVTAATTYPVTLAEAKQHCRIEVDTDDSLVNGLIAAATDFVELYTGRAIMAQTWELVLDSFSDTMMITKGPVSSVTSIKYYDADEALQTLSASSYALDADSEPQWVVRASDATWPDVAEGVNNVIIRYVAGYAAIPPAIKHAALMLIGQWYDQRAGVSDKPISETPHAVKAMLFPMQAMHV